VDYLITLIARMLGGDGIAAFEILIYTIALVLALGMVLHLTAGVRERRRTPAPATGATPPVPEIPAPPVRETTAQGPVPLAFPQFWDALFSAAHLNLYGATDSGKTTLARALWWDVQRRGGTVILIATKARDIWGVRPIGIPTTTSDGYSEVAAVLQALAREIDDRRRRLFAGETLPALWIFIDEERDIATHPVTKGAYATFKQRTTSIARELGAHVVTMNQSNRVGQTGTEGAGDLRENARCIRVRKDHAYLLTDEEGTAYLCTATSPVLDLAERTLPTVNWFALPEAEAGSEACPPGGLPEAAYDGSGRQAGLPESTCPRGHALTEGQMLAWRCPTCAAEDHIYTAGKRPGYFTKEQLRVAQARQEALLSVSSATVPGDWGEEPT